MSSNCHICIRTLHLCPGEPRSPPRHSMPFCTDYPHYWEVSFCRIFGVPKRAFRNATKMDGLLTWLMSWSVYCCFLRKLFHKLHFWVLLNIQNQLHYKLTHYDLSGGQRVWEERSRTLTKLQSFQLSGNRMPTATLHSLFVNPQPMQTINIEFALSECKMKVIRHILLKKNYTHMFY